ncbi:MAG: M28 family peptidase [Bacteroidetes bacterium]|nr:M28 family peptidase [Bacteroidota bacterium]
MKKRLIITLLAAVSLQSKAQTIASLKKDMYSIASDATEGRFTTSPGYLKAANYVLSQLKSAGINKAYLQSVPFSWDDYTGSELMIKGKTYRHDVQNFIVTGRGVAKTGKWRVLKAGDSVKGNPAGVILLPNADQSKDWETTVIRQYRFGYMHYVPDGKVAAVGASTIMVSPRLAKMLAPGDSVNVKLCYKFENKPGYNVVGVLPGTSRQTIVVGAHLDHIGRIGKHIYNGANDDASGCVAELGAAKMLAAHPGKKTVIFAFFCGEELNLKGSCWFASHLPVAQKDMMMTVNLEQLGSKHRSFRGVWALGDTTLKSAFYRAGNNFANRNLQFSPADSVKDILSNTDTYSFMNKHIPSLLLGSGGFPEHHTPQDRIGLIDFAHLQKATRLLFNLITIYRKPEQ